MRPSTGGLGRALIAALTFHVNVLEAQRGYLPANWDILWSLSVEEVFYFFFPLACWLLGRGKALWIFLSLFVILGPFARALFAGGNGVWREYSYLGGMDAIALGCLTALLLWNRQLSRRMLWILGIAGTAVLILSLGFSLRIDAWGFARNGLDMTLLALGTCMLLAVFAKTQWSSPRVLTPLLMLGRSSYEVYLTHMFVVFILFDAFVAHGKPLGAVPLLFLFAIVAATLLGLLIARFYSEPMNRILRRH